MARRPFHARDYPPGSLHTVLGRVDIFKTAGQHVSDCTGEALPNELALVIATYSYYHTGTKQNELELLLFLTNPDRLGWAFVDVMMDDIGEVDE